MADASESREANAELIRRLHAALLEERDPVVVDDFFAEGFVSHNNPPGFPAGRDGVKQFFATFRDAFPDVTVAIDELLVDGDRVAVATTFTGTHEGELMGIGPTGRRVSVTGIDVVRIAAGRIVEHRGLTDVVGLMRQLTE
jgi:predicted ester cyclase